MGRAKAWQMEQWERGFKWVGDKNVCDRCVDDDALRDHILANASATSCSYCENTGDGLIACELDVLMGAIAEGIAVEWDDAENFMPFEGDGWALPEANRHIDDLLADGELGIDVHPELFNDIVEAFSDRTFAPRHYFGLGPEERLNFGWDAFVTAVTHQTRYLFMLAEAGAAKHEGYGEIPTARMLSEIGNVVAEAGLVQRLPAGTMLYRARLHGRESGERPATAKTLGTPPVERARLSNRMSPNGIPMFYGAFDAKTAVVETTTAGWPGGWDITVGAFLTSREFKIVDLTELAPIPSLFDPGGRDIRPSLSFLHRFAAEVSKPVDREEREHLEYVPTQIVTEYFKHAFESEHDVQVDGIVYASATAENGRCIVLFVENEDCVDESDDSEADGALRLASAYSVCREPDPAPPES